MLRDSNVPVARNSGGPLHRPRELPANLLIAGYAAAAKNQHEQHRHTETNFLSSTRGGDGERAQNKAVL
jgi:hypothetical protein